MGKDLSEYLEFLAAFSARFVEMSDLETTLDAAIAEISRFLDVEVGTVFLRQAGGDLRARASCGAVDYRDVCAAVGEGIVGRCVAENVLVTADRDHTEIDFPPPRDGADGHALRQVMCAPLRSGQDVFGALAVLNKRDRAAFNAADEHFLTTAAAATASAVARARLGEIKAEQDRVNGELELAAEIQRKLLPSSEPGTLPVVGINRPIREVSGDFFDFFMLPSGGVPFALGDVSGKGMNAALLMAKTASLFRCLGKSIDDPAALLKLINREIFDTSSRGMFVTMVAGIFDPWSGRLRFANAGHEPPLLRRANRSYLTFPADAPPLGILPDIQFETQDINLESGEFYVFSDGLTEYRYGDREELGVEGLIQLVEVSVDASLDGRLRWLLDELDQSGWELRDDMTVLAIDGNWALPAGIRPDRTAHLADAAPDSLFELRLPARADRLKLIRPGLRAAARMCYFSDAEADDIVLAVSEACQNVITHAYNPSDDGDMVLEVYRRDDGMLVRLRDFAEPVDVSKIEPRDLDDLRPGGLGTHFIREIMDSAEFQTVADGSGNILEMVKRAG